ncbi:hypothetical protein BaRGS_00025242 [Batillaria attramentaria]|uniref:Coiled-coil domain-containing protein 85C n=1 Tax=Batillaria attramentaria TaxID=370345 RepID=A0ABD0K913_9CAEN
MEWENQRPSAPSTPTSISSQSTSGTNSSRERIPPYKQLNPSPAVTALSKLSDDELFRKGADELLRILRRVESDYKGLLSEHSSMVKDVNRRFQIFVLEARGLKEINQKLQDDNQELRDLCCFLDDDRQRSRKLAREWQRFGRYTASVMHSEVAAYQEKLRQLEDRQAELLNDNMELKELCLFLDHERSQISGDRDEGDGSSNGTMTGHEEMQQQSLADSDGQVTPTPTPTPSQQGESAAYIRQLEQKIHRLEEEKKQLAQRVERNGADGYHPADQDGLTTHRMDTSSDLNQLGHAIDNQQGLSAREGTAPSFSMNKPEAVVHAMKVLQVHEQLERPRDPVGTENLGDTEKAIVREMCNVVWRKLGDSGDYPPPPGSSHPSAGPAPSSQSHRPQSAMASHISGGHPGPPRGASSHPASPTSPSDLPSTHQEGRAGQRPPPQVSSQPYQAGPSRLNQSMDGPMYMSGQGDRKGLSSQGPRHSTSQSGQGNYYQSMQGGEGHFSGQNNRSQPMQGPSYSQPVVPPSVHTAVRPSNASQPPPYSSTPSSSGFAGSRAQGPLAQSQPSHYQQGPPQQMPQPHQQPPSRQQQQQQPPRYQQRIHPLHAQQGNPPPPQPQQTQQRPPPSRAMPPATYYVGHPSSQSRHHSASGLSSAPQSAPSSASASTYLYPQRGGQGPTTQSSYRAYEQTTAPPRKKGTGQGEWRQTYLDDRD